MVKRRLGKPEFEITTIGLGDVGHRRTAVGTAGRRGEHWRDPCGDRTRHQLDRHGADLRVGTL